ncbi:sensor histidine kinase [Streptomyces sp. NPDC006527]|uniref:sensor histidine kinase n=1 Tax=Streptomyces sp. NPDC006527 TaxID=3364749 RepID=UPI0036878E6A
MQSPARPPAPTSDSASAPDPPPTGRFRRPRLRAARSLLARPWWASAVARLRTANPYAVDSALAALVLFAASLQWIFPDEGGERLTPLGWILGAATAVPLVWRRRAPFATAVAVSTATTVQAIHHAPPPDVMYGGLVALHATAALSGPAQRRFMLLGWLIGVSVTIDHEESADPYEYAFQLLGVVCAYALGVLARVQRAYATELEDRARRLERERAADTERARAQERSRIARDMHDILAHAVSLMVVQAEAGPVVVRSDPARAEAAFDAIATTGRDAMTQLRRILGVLKEEEGGASARRLPQPQVSALAELVRQVAASTGLRIALRASGEPRPLPPDAEVAAYRVVQEALTNTVKHAYASSAVVELDWTKEALTVTVTDDGRGPVPGADGGHGLVGIRERAAACGGTAEAGRGPDGGFRVVVRLPAAVDRQAALG